MKIAIIGGGISGNVAAYQLHKEHDITVFEANDYVGGHTHTHDIEHQGNRLTIDTGFIVFNYKTYPRFVSLLEKLGVETQASDMGFGVRCERSGLEYSGSTLNSLFAQRSNLLKPQFLRMILDILRFNRQACHDSRELDDSVTLGEYLKKCNYSKAFIEHYIVPMGAAIWSTIPHRMYQFPARFFIRFFHNHGLLNINDRPVWYVIKNGSREYVEPLTKAFHDRIRLKAQVETIRRFPGHVEIRAKGYAPENYDAVFIAAHADQALKMLEKPTRLEKRVLGAFPYQQNEAVLHTDINLMPKRKRAWAAWNYLIPARRKDLVTLTYNMNILQGLNCNEQFLVTLNNTDAIDSGRIIKRIDYAHPVFTQDSVRAQEKHSQINGTHRTWYCGAYWQNGFHEDGVASAMQAYNDFNEYQNEELSIRRAG